MLDAIEFSQDIPDLLQLDFFERAQIELVITNCEHVNEQGHTVCNVKVSDPLTSRFKDKKYLKCELIQRVRVSQLLHRVLVAEVNALQGMAAIGQRPLLMEVSELIITQSQSRAATHFHYSVITQ